MVCGMWCTNVYMFTYSRYLPVYLLASLPNISRTRQVHRSGYDLIGSVGTAVDTGVEQVACGGGVGRQRAGTSLY